MLTKSFILHKYIEAFQQRAVFLSLLLRLIDSHKYVLLKLEIMLAKTGSLEINEENIKEYITPYPPLVWGDFNSPYSPLFF